MSISNKALLVSLNISQWTARKLDRAETAAVAAKHATLGEVARVNKTLLPCSDKLDAVHKRSGEIRAFYYKHTLPWREGMNVLKTSGYMVFATELGQMMDGWRALAADFVNDYPQQVANSQPRLGSLWRAEDYPEPADVARRFNIDVRFYPVPDAGDWRVNLSEAEKAILRDQVTEDVKASEAVAMRDAWRRVYEVVKHAKEKLRVPDAIFRDSMVENARELCSILDHLNIADDPDLDDMRVAVEDALCGWAPDTLRHDPRVRDETAAKLADIERKMGAFYAA